ncbi:MAG: cytochrome oxidase [Betaproteobacteria bacterium]|nr:cytochrome oxidase [Betaproteobacteria bacterium]
MAGPLVSTIKRCLAGFSRTVSLRAEKVEREIVGVAGQSFAMVIAHWGTVLAIVISVSAIYLRDVLDDKAIRQLLLDIHRQLGLLVLIVVPLRLAARFWLGFTDHAANMPAVLRLAAKACHLALYAGLVITPILGWGATNAHRITLTFFGVLPLPALVEPDPDMADVLVDYHVWVFYTLVAIVMVHVLAALWHHFVLRDSVLIAMVRPHRGKRDAPQ